LRKTDGSSTKAKHPRQRKHPVSWLRSDTGSIIMPFFAMAIASGQTATPLACHLRATLAAGGEMTFERFMAACLYDATHGYYGQIHREIGLRGDFFTSVSVGSVFGELLADWVAATWNALDRPASFTLLEQGAHDGQLLEDILVALRARHTDLLSALRLLIIEPLPARQAQQRERLQAAGVPCIWSATLEEAPEQPAGAFLA